MAKVATSSAAYEAILRAGPRLKQLKQAHAHLIVTGYGQSRSLLTKLVTLACSARAIAYAHLLFLSVPLPDEFLFNSIIKSTSKLRFPLLCVAYYRRMISCNRVSPSNYTFTSVIKSCADLSALRIGKGVQCHAVVSGFGVDTYVQASLVTFYSKCGDMRGARQVFDVMPVKSIVAWNSLVSGLEQNGFAEEAIRVFYQMRESGFEPDSATFVSLLSACAHTGAISLGSWVHRYIVQEGLGLNVKLGTTLINLYSRCGDVEKAREVFDIMKETNVAAWTAMISAYGSHGHDKQAMDLFNKMEDGYGPIPNNVTFVAVLSACAHGGLVEEGRSVYKRMTESYGLIPGVEHHVCMIDMLGRAGFLEEAYRFIHQLDAMGKATPPALWTAMLGACKMHKNFDLGVEIAKRLIELEPENPGHHVMLSNIYALSGKTDEVSHIRDGMIKNNLRKQVGYSVITALCREKQCSTPIKAIHPSTFQSKQNPMTQSSTLLHQLTHHSQQRNLGAGCAVHAQIIRTGTSTCTHHSNGLVNLYAKCGHLPKAHSIFNAIVNKDVVSWNSLITGYSQNGGLSNSRTVMQLFWEMRAQNMLPNAYTLTGIFKAESSLGSCRVGRQVHALVVKMSSFGDIYVDTSMLGMYCKAGLVEDGLKVFALMPERNTFTWSTMVSGFATRGKVEEATQVFKLFLREQEESDSDYVFTAVLSSLAAIEYVGLGRQIHCTTVKNGLLGFIALSNAIVTMYSKCESLVEAGKIFDSLGDKNAITWSAMVTGYSQNGESLEAVKLFSRMFSAGVKPSEYTIVGVLNACSDICYVEEGKQLHSLLLKLGFENHLFATTALVDMYAKAGCLADARKGFNCLKERDVALWTSVISGYVQNSDNEEALIMYCGMKSEGIVPNEPTMASVLKACASLATLELGKQMHGHTIKHGFSLEVPIGSALSTMYSKCGSLEDGSLVFQRTPNKDVVSWNAMISGLSHNGRGDEALELFEEMLALGTEPDDVTFVNIISACSHKGFVERGQTYFNAMSDQFGLVPKVDHYACMVDLLSRAGQLKEAKEFIESASIDHGICLWRILLSACKNHGNCELGAYAGEKLMALGSRESSTYVQLSSIYTALGRMREVERVWGLMRANGVSKDVGCSWISLENQFHVFVVGDTMHTRIEEIKELVSLVTRQTMEEGYRNVLDSCYVQEGSVFGSGHWILNPDLHVCGSFLRGDRVDDGVNKWT